MHKQHEDQPSNELPNLSTWHRAPTGAVIPAGVPYAFTYNGGITVDFEGYSCDVYIDPDDSPRFTEHPIAPPLPTEEGATIVASSDKHPPRVLLTREGGRWVNRYGVEWYVDQIHAWAPVAIGETVVVLP